MQDTQQLIEHWIKIRQQGRDRFIWRRGVLGWGVSTTLLWVIGMSLIDGWERFYSRLPLALVLFPLGGYWWGAWMWRWCNAKYEKAMRGNGIGDEE